MFVTECYECGATNDAETPRCVACEADLTAETVVARAQPSIASGVGFVVLGFLWFFMVSFEASLTSQPMGLRDRVIHFISANFGMWGALATASVFWGLAAYELSRVRRLRREASSSGARESSAMLETNRSDAADTATPIRADGLYWRLGVGVGLAAAFCVVTTLMGIAPILPRDAFASQLGYGCAAVVTVSIVAGVVLKGRIPRRSAGQSPEDYWMMLPVASATASTWLALEGAVMLAAVGYFLTAEPAALYALGAALAAFAWANPRECAKL